MNVTLKALLNRLNTELKDRFTRMSQLHDQSSFLLDIESLIESESDDELNGITVEIRPLYHRRLKHGS